MGDQEKVSADLKRAMQMAPATVTVITSGNGADANGLTATSVCSVSLHPPSMLVCVNRDSSTHSLIAESRKFCVNILSEDQRHVGESFASEGNGQEKFERAKVSVGEVGGQPAIEGALANIACTISESLEVGSHTIFIGQVQAIRLGENGTPLLYGNQSFGSFES